MFNQLDSKVSVMTATNFAVTVPSNGSAKQIALPFEECKSKILSELAGLRQDAIIAYPQVGKPHVPASYAMYKGAPRSEISAADTNSDRQPVRSVRLAAQPIP